MLRSFGAALVMTLACSTSLWALTLPNSMSGHVRFLPRNAEGWWARWEAIKSAKTSIVTTYFAVHDDPFGEAFLGLLLEKAKAGVKVKLMLDARGTGSLIHSWQNEDKMQALVAAGVEVRVFNPHLAKGLTKHLVTSNHKKILLIDDHLLLAGGRNIGKDYFLDETDHPTSYYDADIAIDSPEAGAEARAAFESEWSLKDHIFVMKRDRLDLFDRGKDLEAAVRAMDYRLTTTDNQDVKDYVSLMPLHQRHFYRNLANWRNLADGFEKFKLFDPAFTATDVQGMSLLDNTSKLSVGPDGHSQVTKVVHQLIDEAKEEIFIENPYVVLAPETKAKLIAAAKRGVKIIFSTNGPTSTDSLPTESVIVHDWKQIMKEIPGVEIYMDRGPRKVHAKIFVFDHSRSVVGSFNMDSLSDHVNGEVALYVDSKAVAKVIHREIDDHKDTRSLKLSLDPYVGPESIPGSGMKMQTLSCMYLLIRPELPML